MQSNNIKVIFLTAKAFFVANFGNATFFRIFSKSEFIYVMFFLYVNRFCRGLGPPHSPMGTPPPGLELFWNWFSGITG